MTALSILKLCVGAGIEEVVREVLSSGRG